MINLIKTNQNSFDSLISLSIRATKIQRNETLPLLTPRRNMYLLSSQPPLLPHSASSSTGIPGIAILPPSLSLFFPRSSASCSLTTRAHNRSVWGFNHRVEGTGAWAGRNCVGEGWFPRRGWRRNERFLVVGGGGRRKGTFKQLSSRSSRKLGNASFPTNICHLTPNHRLRIDHATSVRFASPPSPPRRACSPRTNTRAC